MAKTIYIGFSFKHHGSYSGYDQIRKFLHYDEIIDCQKSFNLLTKVLESKNIFLRLYKKIFGGKLWWIELIIIIKSLIKPNGQIFHFIYGENIYQYSGFFKRNNKIIITLHQPPSFFLEPSSNQFMRALKKADKLIVMSLEMEEFFKKHFPNLDIKYIPHGVDVNYFKPQGTKKNQVLMVGNWLRDFSIANKVFNRLSKMDPNITIKVLTNPENFCHFDTNENIQFLFSIDDFTLLNLYQDSKIVFLPLIKYTANNAVLEALSCGCSVIIASNEIPNYNESPIVYISFQIDFASELISKSLYTWEKEKEIHTYRSYVIRNFSWERISLDTAQFLQ